jgi:hypothetical protein
VHLFLTANLPHGEVPASTADWTLIGEYGDWASMSWGDGTGATLFPDLDGDGLDEVIVGAHGIEPSGGVYLVPGGNLAGAPAEAYLRDLASAVVEDTSGATTENGTAIGSVGDLDGDGRADLLVQAAYAAWAVPAEVLTSESPTLDAGTLIELPLTWKVGYRMASQPTRLGDIDGDGLDELAVNCGVCSDWGAIYIFSGQEDWTGGSLGAEDADIQILGDGGGLGDNMAGGADLDDDGLGDLAASVTVSYPEFEGVYLFRSVGAGATSIGPSDAELRIMPVEGDDSRQLGMALALTDGAAATDRALVVGDTTPAVAVCDFRASDLQVSGTLTTDSCGRRLVGRDQAALYGGGVLAGGDLNDDGRQDVVIADAGWDPDGVLAEFGAAFLILSRD